MQQMIMMYGLMEYMQIESMLEDCAYMMSSMYDNGLLYYKKYPHLYARMKYLRDILYKNFESIRNCEYDWLE